MLRSNTQDGKKVLRECGRLWAGGVRVLVQEIATRAAPKGQRKRRRTGGGLGGVTHSPAVTVNCFTSLKPGSGHLPSLLGEKPSSTGGKWAALPRVEPGLGAWFCCLFGDKNVNTKDLPADCSSRAMMMAVRAASW